MKRQLRTNKQSRQTPSGVRGSVRTTAAPVQAFAGRPLKGGRAGRTVPLGRLSGWFVLLVLLGVSQTRAALIRFRSSARVNSSVVRLGDVADVHDASPKVETQLKQIVLAPAPPPGRQTVLEFVTIRSRLQVHGVNMAETEFSGPTKILVLRKAGPVRQSKRLNPSERQKLTAERKLAQAVQAYLQHLLPEAAAVRVEVKLSPEDVPAVLTADEHTFQFSGLKVALDVPQQVQLQFRDAGQRVRTTRFSCRLSQRPQVVTVRYTVPRGRVLQESDLSLIPVDDPSEAFADVRHVVGKEAVRTLRPGEPIKPNDVRTVPLVRRNDIVTVYCRVGGIVVRRPFRARDEGSRGDVITLVSLDGRDKITAVVTAFHEAEVIPAGGGPRQAYQDQTGTIRFEHSLAPTSNVQQARQP